MSTKHAILILGMHRSGTSALAGVIHMMGAYAGEFLMPATKDNQKGYYENLDLYNINELILQKLNTSWHDLNEFIIPVECSELSQNLKSKIEWIFGDNSLIMIKDPRICLLLPLYKKVLHELNYEIHIIKTFRKKEEIINSLILRNEPEGFSKRDYDILIEKYKGLIKNEIGLEVNYNHLLNDTGHTIENIKSHFPFLNCAEEKMNKINEFLNKSLKHF